MAFCEQCGTQLGASAAFCSPNLWAFVFGPFYYLYLGLWRRAITILIFVLVADTVIWIRRTGRPRGTVCHSHLGNTKKWPGACAT
jgi:hypothetical protein